MFEQLFVRPEALTRHATGSLADERRRFLAHLEERGLPPVTLRSHAQMLLRVADALRLADRPDEMISRDEIDGCAPAVAPVHPAVDESQATVNQRRATKAREKFRSVATRWLRFLGRLKEEVVPVSPYAEQIDAFADYLQHERGLCPRAIVAAVRFCGNSLANLICHSTHGARSTWRRSTAPLRKWSARAATHRDQFTIWRASCGSFFAMQIGRGGAEKNWRSRSAARVRLLSSHYLLDRLGMMYGDSWR